MSRVEGVAPRPPVKVIEFNDHWGIGCSMQAAPEKEDTAGAPCIWLGVNRPALLVRERAGLRPAMLGPNNIVIGRMLLSRKLVAELLPYLQHYLATGELTTLRLPPEPVPALDKRADSAMLIDTDV